MDQRREALDRANDIRSARAEFKRQMKRTAPAEALHRAAEVVSGDQTPDFYTMKSENFLKALPRVGRFSAGKLLHEAGRLPGTKPLGSLTEQQRAALADAIERLRVRRYGRAEEATHGG